VVAGVDEDIDDGTGLTIPIEHPSSSQIFTTVHSEFGHCDNKQFRRISRHTYGATFEHPKELDPPYYILLTTYISYLWLICIGHMRDFFGKRMKPSDYSHIMAQNVRILFLYLLFSSSILRFHFAPNTDRCFLYPRII
jgi:serine palmitoyltransferase